MRQSLGSLLNWRPNLHVVESHNINIMEPTNVSAPVSKSAPVQNLAGPIELLKSAWQIFKANWKILVPIVVTPSVIMLVGSLFGMIGGAALIITFILSITSAVFSIAMAPAVITALVKIESGSAGSIKYWSQYKEGFKFFGAVLGLGILQGLIILGSGIWFVIPAIVVGVFAGFMIYSRILDGNKGFTAFTDSYTLVKGRWWGVFWRMLFLVLIYIALAIIVGIIVSFFQLVFGKASAVASIVVIVLQLLLTSTVGVLASAYMYKMFTSLKATRMTGVVTGAFKKWLVAFLVIGIIVAILIPFTGMWALLQGFQGARYNNGLLRMQENSLSAQLDANSASSTLEYLKNSGLIETSSIRK